MAERRMFAKTIVDSDMFLDMPLSSQVLYFHLGMRADDDGFVNNPKKIQRMIGASEDDLKLLAAKKFIIPFETGVVVIKHWKIHNYIQKDRHKDTIHQAEMSTLTIEENGSYSLLDTECIQDGYRMDTQVRLDKDSKEKNSKTLEQTHPKDVDGFFEKVWKLYPKKKGKGQISSTQKNKLYNIGYDVISKCIERYVTYFSSTGKDEQFMMYGSTFFNSGYIDYLDDNYTSPDGDNGNQYSLFDEGGRQ